MVRDDPMEKGPESVVILSPGRRICAQVKYAGMRTILLPALLLFRHFHQESADIHLL